MGKERKKREPKPKKEKVGHPAHARCVELYKWFIEGKPEKGFEGITKMAMVFDGGDGKGVNTIIKFIENTIKMREQTDVVDHERVVAGFEFVLKNYSKWSNWHQERTRLKEIASQFSNITNALLKNGGGKNEITVSEIQRAHELLK